MIRGWRLMIVDWCLMIVDWCLMIDDLTIDDCWLMFDGSCLMIDGGWFMINGFWLMIIMMTLVVVWCTRLGWSFIAALNAGCLVPLFPPSSTFTVNKVSLSTTSRAAKRCWDTLLVEAWQVPTKKECLYNSHSRFWDQRKSFFPLEVDKQRLAIQSPTSKTRFEAHRIEKVGNGGDRWRMEEAKWAVEGCCSEWNRKIRKSWSYLLRKRSEFRSSSNLVRKRTEPRRNAEMLMSTLVLDLSHSMSSQIKSTNVQSFHATFGFFLAFPMHGSTHSDPKQVSDSLLWQLEGEPDHLPACHDDAAGNFYDWISDQPWWIRKETPFTQKVPLGSEKKFGVNLRMSISKKSKLRKPNGLSSGQKHIQLGDLPHNQPTATTKESSNMAPPHLVTLSKSDSSQQE